MSEGVFIVIEGPDGTGKTTQVELLRLALTRRGTDVVTVRFPGETEIGSSIRALLLKPRADDSKPHPLTDLLLYAADRVETEAKVILPALNAGKIVIADRYVYSTLAYQGAGSQLDAELTENLCMLLTLGTVPTLVVYLDVEPELGLCRVQASKGGHDRFELEDLAFRERVREGYRALYESAPGEDYDAAWIDTSTQTPEAVHREILRTVFDLTGVPVAVEDDPA